VQWLLDLRKSSAVDDEQAVKVKSVDDVLSLVNGSRG